MLAAETPQLALRPEFIEPLEAPQPHTLAFSTTGKDKAIIKIYNQMLNDFWVPHSIHVELAKDDRGWATLSPGIQHFIKQVLAFFAISDGVVNETLTEVLGERVTLPEARVVYRIQEAMEDVHNVTYNLLIESYVKDPRERAEMLQAHEKYPAIGAKVAWLRRWLGASNPIAKLPRHSRGAILKSLQVYNMGVTTARFIRPGQEIPVDEELRELQSQLTTPRVPLAQAILVNTIMEGIFFQSSFCSIFWINHTYSGALPGLIKANEYISRDEGLHTAFGTLMYRMMKGKLPESEVHTIMREAVEIENNFAKSCLPEGLLNMNAELVGEYVQFMADQLLVDLGYSRIYRSKNPFDFMVKQSTGLRITDFFVDGDVTEYSMGGHESVTRAHRAHLDEEF